MRSNLRLTKLEASLTLSPGGTPVLVKHPRLTLDLLNFILEQSYSTVIPRPNHANVMEATAIFHTGSSLNGEARNVRKYWNDCGVTEITRRVEVLLRQRVRAEVGMKNVSRHNYNHVQDILQSNAVAGMLAFKLGIAPNARGKEAPRVFRALCGFLFGEGHPEVVQWLDSLLHPLITKTFDAYLLEDPVTSTVASTTTSGDTLQLPPSASPFNPFSAASATAHESPSSEPPGPTHEHGGEIIEMSDEGAPHSLAEYTHE